MNGKYDSLHPYSFKLDGDMHYVFTTDAGAVYHAYFIDFSMYAPQFKEVYMFNIEPEGDTTNLPRDIRISHTIVRILSLFFANHHNSMIMVCDSVDGREYKRNMLFDRWYRHYSTADIAKYDASAETEDYMLYVSLFVHKDNTRKAEIVSAFYELVRNNMYPID